MSTPRLIRALRAADLSAYRAWLAASIRRLDATAAASTFVWVPTRAAGDQLRRTIESAGSPVAHWPHMGSRSDLYDALASRLPSRPVLLSPFEREAMLAGGARDAEEGGAPPPFHARPALVAEMLALYDHVRRLGRSVDDVERLLEGELEPAADSDRGAAQLLEQTRFLTAAYRGYEAQMALGGAVDEHALRSQLLATPSETPLRHLIIATADRPFDPDGFWPADVTLCAAIPGLERIDVLSTAGVLDAGFLERLRLAFVEVEEEAVGNARPTPTLIVPKDGFALTYRDREDELEGVAQRVSQRGGGDTPLDQVGLIVARPLPYVYLAREVFGGAHLPFDAVDTLPLAAEPYAAAVDVVLEAAAANFTRRALMALLKSPHFQFTVDGAAITRPSVARLDALMAEQRYLGGLDRLGALVATWQGGERPAAQAALAVATELSPLAESHPMVEQVERLRAFLDRHDRDLPIDRRRRVRGAVRLSLDGLAHAYRRHDPQATGTVAELASALRRWLGSQTFASGVAGSGVRILDTQAARFAELDDVQILGLIEGEWPERARRNVFYPRGLLAQLEPSRPERISVNEDRDQVRHARAVFADLVGLARTTVRLSTFSLESESVVEPSTFVEDVATLGMRTESERDRPASDPSAVELQAAAESPWVRMRASNATRDPGRFNGTAGPWVLPRVSVSRLERYMKCPFQFYVSNVLQVDEEPEDETSRSPLERGRFLHELFETFFHEWQLRGRGRITPADMDDARALFAEIAEPALRSLPPSEAGLERAKLYGSAVGSGIVDRVFTMEAERPADIRERLMEYELDGMFSFAGEDGTTRDVRLRAKIDRVDVLGDGTFRLIDYKTKYVPDRNQALQLPIYSACVRTSLSRERGRDLAASEAMYLSFEGKQAVVPLEERGKDFDALIDAASHRLVAALDNIAAGHFPARPEARNLCSMCAFTAVCRIVGGAPESTEGGDV